MTRVRWESRLGELRKYARMGLPAKIIGEKMGCGAVAVRGACEKYGVRLDSGSRRTLLNYLAIGGYLLREELGGVVGYRWTTPQRDGKVWNRELCDEMVRDGSIVATTDANVWRVPMPTPGEPVDGQPS